MTNMFKSFLGILTGGNDENKTPQEKLDDLISKDDAEGLQKLFKEWPRKMSLRHVCAKHGHKKCLNYFLFHVDDENFKKRDINGNTPLYLAIENRQVECSMLLFYSKKYNFLEKNKKGKSALNLLNQMKKKDPVLMLIKWTVEEYQVVDDEEEEEDGEEEFPEYDVELDRHVITTIDAIRWDICNGKFLVSKLHDNINVLKKEGDRQKKAIEILRTTLEEKAAEQTRQKLIESQRKHELLEQKLKLEHNKQISKLKRKLDTANNKLAAATAPKPHPELELEDDEDDMKKPKPKPKRKKESEGEEEEDIAEKFRRLEISHSQISSELDRSFEERMELMSEKSKLESENEKLQFDLRVLREGEKERSKTIEQKLKKQRETKIEEESEEEEIESDEEEDHEPTEKMSEELKENKKEEESEDEEIVDLEEEYLVNILDEEEEGGIRKNKVLTPVDGKEESFHGLTFDEQEEEELDEKKKKTKPSFDFGTSMKKHEMNENRKEEDYESLLDTMIDQNKTPIVEEEKKLNLDHKPEEEDLMLDLDENDAGEDMMDEETDEEVEKEDTTTTKEGKGYRYVVDDL